MGNSANKELQRQVEIFNKNGVTNKTGQRTKNFKQLSVKDLLKLQQQILLEYPFLSTVWESMLVTDMATEDNVIVYANDQFERMTLYPKEEIIGRNCRFLQGELTDRDTVSKIRNAVEKGLKLDVQLLNYRKDGVPFWNNFMMLPIHKKGKKAGQVTHFIAIQKDVTLLKEVGEGDPKNWSAPEVCMWLEHHGLGGHHLQIISKKIDGKKLLELSKEDLPMLGFELAAERKKLLKLIHSLEDDEDDAWEEPRKKAKVSKELKEKFKKVVPAENSGKEGDDVAADAGKEIWKEKKPDAKGVKDYLLAVKCFLEGFKEPVVFLVPSDVTFDQLKNQIESKFGCDVSMMHKDEDEISVENDEDLKSVLLLTEGGTLPLHLEREKTKMKASTTRYINSLPTPHVITDAGNYVLFANLAAKQLLGNYLRKDLSELVSGLQKSGPTGPEGVKVTLNTSNSSKKGKKKDDSVSANLVITQTYKSRLIWSFETK